MDKVTSIEAIRYNVFSPFHKCNACEGLPTRKEAEHWIADFKKYCFELKGKPFPYPLIVKATVIS